MNYISNFKNIVKSLIKKMGYEIKKTNSVFWYKKYEEDYRRLAFYIESNKNSIIKLHFGCGCRIFKGWINLDLNYCPFDQLNNSSYAITYPINLRGDKDDFYFFDVRKYKLPFQDNSVDVIFHEDFIEHLHQKDQIRFFAECLRVLKPGCVHRVNTPDLIISMKTKSNFNKGFDGIYIGEWDINDHINLLTTNLLKELAILVGYSNVIINTRNNSISAFIPPEYRPGNDREEIGNIFADLTK